MQTCSTKSGGFCLALVLGAGATLAGAQTANTTVPDNQKQAQSTAPPSKASESEKVFLLPTGTQLVAEFQHGLNVKKLKPGDQVKAVLTQDLLLRGQILAPAETKLVGHVVEAVPATEKDGDSRLAIVFDRAILKKHQELVFNGIIAAMRPPAQRQSLVDKPDQMMPPPVMQTGSIPTQPRGSGRSTSTSNNGTSTSTLVALGQLNATPTVQSTPGSSPGTSVGGVRATEQVAPATGGVGSSGVYGIKNVALLPAGPNGSKPSVIVGKKSNLKLDTGTQIILVVAGSPLAVNRP